MSHDASLAAQPFYLDTRGGTVLCWWHAPVSVAQTAPVLMCPTWGDEEIGAYGGWRALANDLAQRGVPVLRLDLPGEGDSLELPAGGSCWAAWLDALEDAALALQHITASPRVHLLGLRLGALLAAQVADRLRQQADTVASLLLLAPVASGRAYLREARLLNSASRDETLGDDDVPAGGFVLEAPSAQAVQAATWPTRKPDTSEVACPVWLLERSDRPLSDTAKAVMLAWAGAMECSVRDDLTGITNIAHSAAWPQLAEPLADWFLRLAGPPARDGAALVWPTVSAQAQGLVFTEEVVSVGSRLVAQCTRPTTAASVATIFLSSGAERRIGPHRLWVRYARARAAAGELCLRMDLAGIGDSADRPGVETRSAADVIYDPRCVDDVREALDWLKQQHGLTDVRLVGLCSGAYHAWRCAVSGLPLSKVVVINPLVYHWRSGMSLDPTHHAFGQIDIADGAVRSLKDFARWRKLLRGQVHVKVIFRALAARSVGQLRTIVRAVARRLRWPLSEDVVSDLRQVIRHGTPMTFVFSSGEPGHALLRREAGGGLSGLIGRAGVHLATIERADHTFSTPIGRDSLYNCLNSILSKSSDLPARGDRNSASLTPLQS